MSYYGIVGCIERQNREVPFDQRDIVGLLALEKNILSGRILDETVEEGRIVSKGNLCALLLHTRSQNSRHIYCVQKGADEHFSGEYSGTCYELDANAPIGELSVEEYERIGSYTSPLFVNMNIHQK